MIIFFAILASVGWLCGVWMPWWGISIIMIVIAISGYKGAFDGGLEAIPPIIGTLVFIFFMVTFGFSTGDTAISDIANAIKYAFTGS